LANKQNILKNVQVNWFDKKTINQQIAFFLLPSTYAAADDGDGDDEAVDAATTLKQSFLGLVST
jgi:hypothetical protein